jgi:GH15 family glucan-1,4-alpha-glucosidase
VKKSPEYLPIENYGIIGNMKTIALVSLDGNIDFMCFPDFDSPTIFASLLDKENGGSFSVTPQFDTFKTKQLYIPGTAVLLTRFFSDDGIAEVTDYMPLEEGDDKTICAIVRRIKTIRGKVNYTINCAPRFDYAKASHEIEKNGKQELTFSAVNDGNTVVRLIADFPLKFKGNDGYAEFSLAQGEESWVVLESAEKTEARQLRNIDFYKSSTYQETITFWRHWTSKSTYKGRWTDLVLRSAITLKLLTSASYGSMVAAPTFSLPESIGNDRNWDYRFTWIRDAAFTMYAFLRLGYWEEASGFLKWIHERSGEDVLKLMYNIDGSPVMEEEELEHMEGYMASGPVRIGNAAKDQHQLDIYGELIDTIYLYNKNHSKINYEFWQTVQKPLCS